MDILNIIDKLHREISTQRPFDQNTLDQIREYYRIGLTYTSNALEGNSLTESETKIVLEEGITIGGKRLIDHLEAIGHSDAYDFIYSCIKTPDITEKIIKNLHKLFYHRIDSANAGIYRNVKVYITGSKHSFPGPDLLQKLMCDFIESFKDKYGNRHPVEQAAYIHKDFVFIHPFIDGNGRVSRLLMNIILLQHGYNIAIIPPILRSEYIRSLEMAHTDDRDFINFVAGIVKESQRDYIRLFLT